MEITLELLREVCDSTNDNTLMPFIDPLNQVCSYYDINTPERISGFLSQTAHESGSYRFIKENLNYSAQGLCNTFKKYFPTLDIATPYARKPQMIANRVYANRMSNGDEASGDGWRYCGRGLIQLTGKANYTRFANDLGMSPEDTAAYMESVEGATASAGWFWYNNNLNQYCDSGDLVTLTKRINGGTHGLDDRKRRYDAAMAFIQGQ